MGWQRWLLLLLAVGDGNVKGFGESAVSGISVAQEKELL